MNHRRKAVNHANKPSYFFPVLISNVLTEQLGELFLFLKNFFVVADAAEDIEVFRLDRREGLLSKADGLFQFLKGIKKFFLQSCVA